jgi:hypothetical protein
MNGQPVAPARSAILMSPFHAVEILPRDLSVFNLVQRFVGEKQSPREVTMFKPGNGDKLKVEEKMNASLSKFRCGEWMIRRGDVSFES